MAMSIITGAARLTSAFRQLDTKGDGIAPEVLGRLLQYLDARTWTKDKVELLIGAVITKQNGKIHCEDFVAWLMEGATPNELALAGSAEEEVLVAMQFASSQGPSLLASRMGTAYNTAESWFTPGQDCGQKYLLVEHHTDEADMLIAALPKDDAYEEAVTQPPTRRPSIEDASMDPAMRLMLEEEGNRTLFATDDSLLQSIQRATSQGPTLLTSALAEANRQLAEQTEEALLAEVLCYSDSEPPSREPSKAPPEHRGECVAELSY